MVNCELKEIKFTCHPITSVQNITQHSKDLSMHCFNTWEKVFVQLLLSCY